jgi:hypothetical protein
VEFLPEGEHFNNTYFVKVSMQQLLENICPEMEKNDPKPILLHLDNTHPHNSKAVQEFMVQNHISRSPQPQYSLDIAPCNYFLFGNVKRLLAGMRAAGIDELSEKVITILEDRSHEQLRAVFDALVARIEKVIEFKGGYYQ